MGAVLVLQDLPVQPAHQVALLDPPDRKETLDHKDQMVLLVLLDQLVRMG